MFNLRAEFGEEAEKGFPRLGKVPHTRAVQFLDYFASIDEEEQSQLLDALAARAFVQFHLMQGAGYPSDPAFDRHSAAVTSQGPFTGGFRYCDIKFIASIPKIAEFGGYEGWVENYQKPSVSELALTPRADLLPDLETFKPAKAALLRKLLKRRLEEAGFERESSRGGEHKYLNQSGDCFRADFGSYMGQLCYTISAVRGDTRIVMMSYEAIWSVAGGWDYLTEENAERTVAMLPELANYLIGLTERIAGLRHQA
jgi:hypothetical protein